MSSRSLFIALLATAIFASGHATAIKYSKQKLPAVILVPGAFGNELNSDNNMKLWLDGVLMYFRPMDFINGISLKYDPATHTTSNRKQSNVYVPGTFGDVAPVETLAVGYNYMWALTSFLKDSLGYDNNNIRAAPYDFRKAPNELGNYFKSLTELVETSRRNSGGPVVLIAHSYGALLMNYYLNTKTPKWRQDNIASLITMAGAWGGSKEAVAMLAAGVGPMAGMGRAITRTFPSIAFQLPNAEVHKDEIIVEKDGRRYGFEEIDELLSEMGADDSVKMHADTKNLVTATTAPHVKLHCIYSANVKTFSSLKYGAGIYTDKNVTTEFPGKPLVLSEDLGDGSLGIKTLEFCKSFSNHQSEPVVSYKLTDPKIDHIGIMSNKQTMKYIGDIIANEAYSTTSKDMRTFSYVPEDIKIKHKSVTLEEYMHAVLGALGR